jgi:NAD(P)H-dependent FMN reductase
VKNLAIGRAMFGGMPLLQVVVASVRKGRQGIGVARWFVERAQQHAKFDVELVDLQAVNLPMLDEPNHPRLKQYQHAHTKAWSATVSRADAFVVVTPEHNYGPPPALVNALDYLYVEWHYKAMGFVSYGGVSGGTRSVQVTKQIVTTLKMVPIVEAVTVPFFSKLMDEGTFKGGETHDKAAVAMLDELQRWTEALKALRAG